MARKTSLALVTVGVLLAGCATPLQQCLYDAEQPAREIERTLSEEYATLSRGYSIERIRVPTMSMGVCGGPGGAAVPCARPDYDINEIHHRVDRDLVRERIALLERQLARERPRAAAASAQCQATYPAG
ncbi:hypothetical protein [Pararhodobacter zhoushanensis]|uniref:hypothetical protein n=1 Tax=Pararhodobacter zhoushanensis TaxID=2479545 RepID=UPI000F8E17DD|nr:hypothetical protein [Pararhodobacter zhoushanensis]